MTVPFSRAAWETWQDIYYAVNAKLMEPPPLAWCCRNNPFVIDVQPTPRTYSDPAPG